jgi:hypothetical protein
MRPPGAVALAALAAALGAAAGAEDLTGRAILSYQTFDNGGLRSDGVHQLYDLRFERAVTDPIRLRLSLRAERDNGGSDFGLGRQASSFSQLQPGGELFYGLPRLQVQLNYDRILLDAAEGPVVSSDRSVERKLGRLFWKPDGLPGLVLNSDERDMVDDFAGLDRRQTLREATVDYAFRGLTVSGTRRGIDLDDVGLGFMRQTDERQAQMGYEGAWKNGRLVASATGLYTSSQIDDRARGRAAGVPDPVPVPRALYVNDDTPLDSRDRPPTPLQALIDGDLDRGTGIALGPEGVSFQTLVLDAGRSAQSDLFRIHVRDAQGRLVPSGGAVSWDVYVSRDGVEWRAVPGGRTSFLPAQGAYEVRFPAATSRYFKAVSFATNALTTEVTEIEAFLITLLGPEEVRRTDMTVGSATVSLGAQPLRTVQLGYYGLYNGLTQTDPDPARADLTTRGLEHQLTAEYDPFPPLSLIARFQDRSLVQDDVRDTYQAWIGTVRVTPLRTLEQTVEGTHSHERNRGRSIVTDGLALRTSTWFYPTIHVTLDLGFQRQDFVEEGFAVDRRFLNGVALVQLTRALKLTVDATLQRSAYEQGALPLLPDLFGVPARRDERWTAELFYRASSQLGVAARVGQARTEAFTATLQRYHVDWFPFRGGAVALSGIYDQDVDSVGRRTARRFIFTPVWTVNRHVILSLNYTFIDVAGPERARTRAFQALATLTL